MTVLRPTLLALLASGSLVTATRAAEQDAYARDLQPFHRSDNLPLILAGDEGMGFVQGRHVAFNGQTPVVAIEGKAPPMKKDLGKNPASVSDLLRTISERRGVEAKGFGESRRTLDELLS